MCAIMAAGPGTLIIPAAVRLTEPVACAGNERIEYRRVRYSHHRPGESGLEVACADRASGAGRDAMFPAMATLFGIYFVVLFTGFLLRSSLPAKHETPGVPSPT
jgi:hypothetical protein